MNLPNPYRTGTNVRGDLGRDTGPTFAEAKLLENQNKGFLGTGITSKDFGVMADTAMYLTDLQGKRQKQQAAIKISEAKEPLKKWEAMERIPTKELPEDVLTPEQLTQEYVLSSEVMPSLYKKFYSETIPLAAEGISTAGFRDDWVAQAEGFAAKDINNVVARSTARYEKQVLNAQNDDYKRLLDEEKFGLAVGVVDGMNISDEKKQLLVHGIKGAQERSYLHNIGRQGNLSLIDETINRLQDKGCSQYMTSQECSGAVNSLQASFNRNIAARDEAQKHGRQMFWADVQKGIMDGSYSESDLEYDYNQGQLNPRNPDIESVNPQQYIQALRQIRSKNTGAIKLSGQMSFVDNALSGNELVNPANTEHTKAIEAYIANKPDITPAEVTDLVKLSGYLPQVVQDQIEGGAINGNPEQANKALEMFSTLQASGAHYVAKLDDRATDILEQAAFQVRGGADVVQAIDEAKETLRIAPEQKEFRETQYRAVKLEDNVDALDKFIKNDGTGFETSFMGFGGDSSTGAMQAEFSVKVEANFMKNGGNLAMAQQQAYNDLRTVWGNSTTGSILEGTDTDDSRRVMKLPPEQVMNMDRKTSQDLLDMFSIGYGLNPEDVIIHTDATTSAGDKSWSVATLNKETGEVDIPLDKETMQQLRWRPGDLMEAYSIAKQGQKIQEDVELRAEIQAEREAEKTYGRGNILKTTPEQRKTMIQRFLPTPRSDFN